MAALTKSLVFSLIVFHSAFFHFTILRRGLLIMTGLRRVSTITKEWSEKPGIKSTDLMRSGLLVQNKSETLVFQVKVGIEVELGHYYLECQVNLTQEVSCRYY